MTLSDLKPKGYKLIDVHPDFRGMPYREWKAKVLASQADAYRETKECKAAFAAQKWHKRAVATHRDNYGIKGI